MTRGPSLTSQGCTGLADGEAKAPREDVKGTGRRWKGATKEVGVGEAEKVLRKMERQDNKETTRGLFHLSSSYELAWITDWGDVFWSFGNCSLEDLGSKRANKMVSQGSCFYGNYVSMLHTYGVAQTIVLPWNYSKTSHPEKLIALFLRLFWKMWLLRQTSRCLSEHGERLISFFHYIVFENLFLINFLTDFSLQLLFRDNKKKNVIKRRQEPRQIKTKRTQRVLFSSCRRTEPSCQRGAAPSRLLVAFYTQSVQGCNIVIPPRRIRQRLCCSTF